MAKYNFEQKREVVQAYLNGEGGVKYLATKYGIPATSNVRQWIKCYKEFGDDGLRCSTKNKIYTFEFKLHVVELYLTTNVSYQELALSVGINNYRLICKWVNDYKIVGSDALRPKKKGPRKVLKLQSNSTSVKQTDNVPANTSAEHVKQLEEELLKLKIENAYLKELRRLRLGEISRNKKRELFIVSEDHSN